MRSDPTIVVFCDCNRCSDSIEVGLTMLARGSYDERGVERELVINGWLCADGRDLCIDCKDYCEEDYKDDEEEE